MLRSSMLRRLGPGLLFAGAAVGVSHLVMSTKAGALYGFGLLWLVLLANLLKYPFFEFGPRYTSATGETLLEGYQRMSSGILWLFVVLTLGTMFSVQAAVTLVTASIAQHLFGGFALLTWVGILLGICAALLLLGRYRFLDQLMKGIILLLTLVTLVAVVTAFVNKLNSGAPLSLAPSFPLQGVGLSFVVAFIGWMPAPLDLSVWHSLWVEQKQAQQQDFKAQSSRFDFNVGYVGTAVLAIFFLSLGSLVMFDSGVVFETQGAAFAEQLLSLYTRTLGEGAGTFVAIAAFTTMFSTSLTCLDALPRTMARAQLLLLKKTTSAPHAKAQERSFYWAWMLVLIVGAMLMLYFLFSELGSFIQLATILSFLTTPFIAFLNYRLVTGKYMPEAARPTRRMRLLSWIGMLYLAGFAAVYVLHLLGML